MGMAKKQVWPKSILNKKDARRDFMKNAPDGASRSLTRSPFLQKHTLNKKDVLGPGPSSSSSFLDVLGPEPSISSSLLDILTPARILECKSAKAPKR